MNKKQAAEVLGVTVKTIDKWVAAKYMPYIKISGKCVRFDTEVLSRFVKSHVVEEKK